MPRGIYDHRGKCGFLKGHPFYPGGERGWFKKGQAVPIPVRRKISLSLLGNTHTLGKAHSLQWRTAMSQRTRGERHWNWQGGITPVSFQARRSSAYSDWRRQVFQRDDFRCYDCGERGGRLEAHHIYPFALFPRLRFAVENGRTLCKPCHLKTPRKDPSEDP